MNMTALQQAQQWLTNGFLDSLPEEIEYTEDDGTKFPPIVQVKPKGIIGNLDQLSKAKQQKDISKYNDQIKEIVNSINYCVKKGIINAGYRNS